MPTFFKNTLFFIYQAIKKIISFILYIPSKVIIYVYNLFNSFRTQTKTQPEKESSRGTLSVSLDNETNDIEIQNKKRMKVEEKSDNTSVPATEVCFNELIRNGKIEMIQQRLEDMKESVESIPEDLFVQACKLIPQDKSRQLFKILIEANIDPLTEDHLGYNAILSAVSRGEVDVLRALFDSVPAINVNTQNSKQISALMMSADIGNTAVLEYLLSLNPNIDLIDQKGRTALIWAYQHALEKSAIPIVRTLLQHQAHPLHEDNYQYNALLWAASRGYTRVLDALLEESGLSVDTQNSEGVTALMIAAQFDQYGMINHLISLKANPFIRDNDRFSALDLAKMLSPEICPDDIVDMLAKYEESQSPASALIYQQPAHNPIIDEQLANEPPSSQVFCL